MFIARSLALSLSRASCPPTCRITQPRDLRYKPISNPPFKSKSYEAARERRGGYMAPTRSHSSSSRRAEIRVNTAARARCSSLKRRLCCTRDSQLRKAEQGYLAPQDHGAGS
jgi:hypothetical protein